MTKKRRKKLAKNNERSIIRVDLDKLFPNEWLEKRREYLRSTEAPGASDLAKSFGRDSRLIYYLLALGKIALEHSSMKEGAVILLETEEVCNRLGITSIKKGPVIEKCLTKKHEECEGRYENILSNQVIECHCTCHSNKVKTA